MFTSELSEATSNRVLIDDFDADIVKQFVDYIHHGCVDAVLDANSNVELLRIADKYDVEGLKKLAIDRIIPQLTLTNIAAIFNFGVLLQDVDKLLAACSDFMAKNRTQVKEANIVESLGLEANKLLLNAILCFVRKSIYMPFSYFSEICETMQVLYSSSNNRINNFQYSTFPYNHQIRMR